MDGDRTRRTLGFASLGGATLDNEENYLIKKLFTALGAIQIFEAGMASARDPKYTIVPQRQRQPEPQPELRTVGSDPGDPRPPGHTGTCRAVWGGEAGYQWRWR